MREFGDLEMAIMQVMWAGDRPYVVREVRERMQYGRPVAYTTVMTVMNILHRKGVLHREKLGRAWQYWPVEAREDHDARLMTEVLRSGGDEDVTMTPWDQGPAGAGQQAIADGIPGAEKAVIAGSNHSTVFDNTAEHNRIVIDFFQRHSAG